MKRKNYFKKIIKAEDKIFRIADDEIMTPALLAEYIRQHELLVQSHYKYLDDAYQTDYSIFHQAKKRRISRTTAWQLILQSILLIQ